MSLTSKQDLSGVLSGLARWEDGKLCLSEKARLRVARPYLSPSSASSYNSCPARFAVERLLPRPTDPFGAAELGTAGHAVLEALMGLEPERRTQANAMRILREHIPACAERVSAVLDVFTRLHASGTPTLAKALELSHETELSFITQADLDKRVRRVYDALSGKVLTRAAVARLASGLPQANELVLPVHEDVERWVEAVWGKIAGLWQIEDPTKADVLYRELRVEQTVDGVPLYGIIDRIDRGASGIPIVVDYKTGNPKGHAKHGDQLRGYCVMAAHVIGIMPHRAVAYYTAKGERKEVNASRQSVNRTLDVFARTWQDMQAAQEEGKWATKPSSLCGWCPLVLVCPAAQAAGRLPRTEAATVGPELGVAQEGEGDRSVPTDRQPKKEVNMPSSGFGIDSPPQHQSEDGRLNPNSYTATALFALVEMAVKMLNQAGEKLTQSKVDALTQTFAKLLADCMIAVGARPSYQSGLHTRLRGALWSALEHFPAPFGRTDDEWAEWYQMVLRRLVSTAQAVLRLWELDELPECPWAALAAAERKVA